MQIMQIKSQKMFIFKLTSAKRNVGNERVIWKVSLTTLGTWKISETFYSCYKFCNFHFNIKILFLLFHPYSNLSQNEKTNKYTTTAPKMLFTRQKIIKSAKV